MDCKYGWGVGRAGGRCEGDWYQPFTYEVGYRGCCCAESYWGAAWTEVFSFELFVFVDKLRFLLYEFFDDSGFLCVKGPHAECAGVDYYAYEAGNSAYAAFSGEDTGPLLPGIRAGS